MTTSLVLRYSTSDWSEVAHLLDTSSAVVQLHPSLSGSEAARILTRKRVRELLDRQTTAAWIARSDGQLVGFTTLVDLPWDSQQLGFQTGRLDYLVASGSYSTQTSTKKVLLEAALQCCSDLGIVHLSCRIDAADHSSLHTLEQAGFLTVDGILTFAMTPRTTATVSPPPGFQIALATPNDREGACRLAREAGFVGRFRSDPVISSAQTDALYALWISNSIDGQNADAVFVAKDDTSVAGFVTCKLHGDTYASGNKRLGTIGLVATSPHARGTGVARATTHAALNWFQSQNVDIVEVGTQLENVAASRLYESCGFRMVGASVSLRKVTGAI